MAVKKISKAKSNESSKNKKPEKKLRRISTKELKALMGGACYWESCSWAKVGQSCD